MATMAKPLGEKAKLIREAVQGNPDLGNMELADSIEVTPAQIAQQKQAMKKADGAATSAAKKPGRPATAKAVPNNTAPVQIAAPALPATASAAADPVDLIQDVFTLARKCGGVERLKRLVDTVAEK
jgi:hypothetical protein